MNLNHKPRLKRLTTREPIIRAIEAEQDQLAMALSLCGQYELEIAEIQSWFGLHPNVTGLTEAQSDIWHGKFGRLKLVRNELAIRNRSIPRHQSKLLRLKLTLAEFDTVPMEFLTDGSVVGR